MSGSLFRGIHSSKFGITTQDQNQTIFPPRREGKITIPGCSGYYGGVIGNVYDERSESILCTFKCPAGKTVPGMCRGIAYWLSGTGRLAYDREPDKYYTASVSGSPPMEQHLKYGEFTLTWNYNPPFALGRTVTQQIAAGENPVYYQGTAETPCLIVVRNLSGKDILNITIQGITPHFSLWNGSPEDSGSELSGDNYQRVPITFGAPTEQASGQIIARNSAATAFPSPSTLWGTWTYSVLYSAEISGEPVFIKPLTEAKELKWGYMPTIAEGAVEVGIN